jgi:hypothetical protein
MSVSPEAFIEAWQKSTSAVDVGKALDMNPMTVTARAVYYRKLGIKLKHMDRARGRPRMDVAALNKIAAKHDPKK